MFVKVIYAREVTNTHSELDSEHILECVEVHVTGSKESVLFALVGNDGMPVKDLQIDKKSGAVVYIMNNEGRTIDTYRWATDLDMGPQEK